MSLRYMRVTRRWQSAAAICSCVSVLQLDLRPTVFFTCQCQGHADPPQDHMLADLLLPF